MTRDIITVSPSLKIKDLAMILTRNQISGAPVVDKQGKIVGIVSEADIIAKRGKETKAIMSKKVITVPLDASVEEIARLMAAHAITRLPVIDNGKIIGIVSRADIVQAIAMGEHTAIHAPVYDL
ncbi:MAG TPA: CBS domain-containing protein [Candidatus Limnocylindria bacterium]|nr:CBS domain-containing protein [Candidatus Limnocylindria bacterium]